MFATQKHIREVFPNLSSLSHFREAMPFFDNPKHKLEKTELAELLQVINSNASNQEKNQYVKDLQKAKIGRKNPRTQRLTEMQGDAKVFIDFYNLIYTTIKDSEFKAATKKLKIPDTTLVRTLAQNTGALSADGLKLSSFEIPDTIGEQWKEYAHVVKHLSEKEGPVERRRFRRLIPPERMLRLSEMLYALTDEQNFTNFRAS